MSRSSESRQPLSRAEADEVLRYWLAAVQQEEALMARPKARAPARGSSVPRLDVPGTGQEYFKLLLEQAAPLFEGKAPPVLHRAFDAELRGFFESWLSGQYRRGEQERAVSHLLTFPVVHLARGELAGLLRCPLEVDFAQAGGAAFAVPTRTQRRNAQYPAPPDQVRVAIAEQSEQRWPFFVDTRLLQQQLGVVRERIDETFERLRSTPAPDARCMLELICELLESELLERSRGANTSTAHERVHDQGDGSRAEVGVGELIARIHAACAGLLKGGRARVYPVALVIDSARTKASYYLQRDLSMLLDDDAAPYELDSCLGAYLTGAAPALGMAVQRGLFQGPALSPSQRYAAERCGGSRFTAVQGPPGTGKTTLILHLAAEALIKQVDTLLDTSDMGDALMLVTSTNNRAVDNVTEGLSDVVEQALPLALRVGSQQVCEQLLAGQLEQVRVQLEAAKKIPLGQRELTLQAALDDYRKTRSQLEAALAARIEAFKTQTERAELSTQLERLARELAATAKPRVPAKRSGRLRDVLDKIAPRLEQMSLLAEAKASLPALQTIDREQRRLSKKLLPELEEALAEAGLKEALGLPPVLPPTADPAVLLTAWSEAIETAQSVVEGLQRELTAHVDSEIRRERARILALKLERLPEPQPPPAYDPAHDPLQRALFEAAVRAREAWAAAEAEDLCRVLLNALTGVRGERSLRRLWKDGARDYKRLRQLFGVWGCTLLSLGNCVPADPHAIELLVIDEAGQCHPAYAVSGLLRAERALVIGDVHQLEPVIEIEPDDDERVIKACRLQLSRAALEPYRVHSQAYNSVQALADRAVSERPSLSEHFRCQPEIIDISDRLCSYALQVLTPREGPTVPLPFLTDPVSLLDVAGEQERLGGSWFNRAELEHTLELLQSLTQHGVSPSDIAVITPYRGQLEQLRKRCSQAGLALDRSLELADMEELMPQRSQGIALGTVHRFQGGERSIVLFSCVVTRSSSLGFMDDRANLLNVAVSRARHRLVVLGRGVVLAQGRRTRLLTSAARPLQPEAFRMQLGLGL
ncbi:MAG TPA: AAA domain-containing protein [Polyangiales bacterium]|nr:AAA domain-containing protein [Polyangiales bacterium]